MLVGGGRRVGEPIPSMPGQFRLSVDELVSDVSAIRGLGIDAVLLFGLPDAKDPAGSGAYADDGIVQQAVRTLRAAHPDLIVMTDVCLCEYTTHGHCGLVRDDDVDNDATLELLARTAVSQAVAGADVPGRPPRHRATGAPPPGGEQRQRRVRDGKGGGGTRRAGWARGGPGGAQGDPRGGPRPHHPLSWEGGRLGAKPPMNAPEVV